MNRRRYCRNAGARARHCHISRLALSGRCPRRLLAVPRERDDWEARHRQPSLASGITAVIPARDEAEGIGECIGSLLRQDYHPGELVAHPRR